MCANFIHDYNCPLPSNGARGVTKWAAGASFGLAPGASASHTFTCTRPKCYQGKDNCNVTFGMRIDANSTKNDAGPLRIFINNSDLNTPIYHSRIKDHDVKIGVDLAPNASYDDIGFNTIKFVNNDAQRTIYIDDLRVKRVYGMCDTSCNGHCHDDYCDNPSAPHCMGYYSVGSSGTLDVNRYDYPCNQDSGGGRSYTYFIDNPVDFSIPGGAYHDFTLDMTGHKPVNYVGKDFCLYNMNQMALENGYPCADNDVKVSFTINGHQGGPVYYLSRQIGHNTFPTIDLADTTWGGQYNDTGSNTIRVQNNTSGTKLISVETAFNIYRGYMTSTF